jgi:hypothetical protein
VTLASWRVPVLSFDPDEALAVLETLSGADEDTAVGASTRHLMELAGFARDLVIRGRLLPTIDEAGAAGGARCSPDRRGLGAGPGAGAAALGPGRRRQRGRRSSATPSTPSSTPPPARTHADQAGKDAWRQWLAGLSSDRTVRVPPAAVPELARALRDWQRDAVAGRVRACFRLTEPPETDENPDTWRLEFALQAADQPSLLVNADKVWGARGSLKALKRHLDDPQETLLAGSSAGPAGSTASWTILSYGEAHRPRPRPRRGAPVPPRGRAAAGRGRLRGAAAGLVEQAEGAAGREAVGLDPDRARAPSQPPARSDFSPLWTTNGSWRWATSR